MMLVHHLPNLSFQLLFNFSPLFVLILLEKLLLLEVAQLQPLDDGVPEDAHHVVVDLVRFGTKVLGLGEIFTTGAGAAAQVGAARVDVDDSLLAVLEKLTLLPRLEIANHRVGVSYLAQKVGDLQLIREFVMALFDDPGTFEAPALSEAHLKGEEYGCQDWVQSHVDQVEVDRLELSGDFLEGKFLFRCHLLSDMRL
jgi:hypothetical protein